ncbi:unnamed protein product [Clonostachys byssicola]|uniref:Uncharacterized protein n=1 Tax=Clonostachys byssicola TaxID=160290 RepID=A0A9N9U7T7_9HYPO|nr:unnamed protein product [Clonostachys byssicola]
MVAQRGGDDANLRITEEANEEDDRGLVSASASFKKALADPATYLIMFMLIASTPPPFLRGDHWVHIIWPQVFASVGFIISAATINTAARYAAAVMMLSIYGSFSITWSWVSTSIPRPATKHAAAFGIINSCLHFQPNICNVVFSCLCMTITTALFFTLKFKNRRLREAPNADIEDEGIEHGTKPMALSDRWELPAG